MPRKILHLDLDAFYCAVEELNNPALKGKPFAVGGSPDSRGVISSCSYPARQFGVRSAMPTVRALKLCPQLIVIGGNYHSYHEASEKVMAIINDLTPLVEQISIDEAFMDVSDLPESSLIIAQRLQLKINNQLFLPCSIGAASNKLVAKVATDMGKSGNRGNTPPNAILIVPPGTEAEFLAPLQAQAIWGIGPKMAARLAELEIYTVADLAKRSEAEMVGLFGKYGRDLYLRARGIDDSPVETVHDVKSISQEVTFARDVTNLKKLEETLLSLSDQVAYRLRKSELAATTVKIKLRWPDFSTITRQKTLSQPTDLDRVIFEAALELLRKEVAPGQAVRLLGVGATGLGPQLHQLELFTQKSEKERALSHAVDELKQRFGAETITRASRIKPSRPKPPRKPE